MTMPRFVSVVAGLVLCGAASGVIAHAFLDHASPAVGSKVHASPTSVRVWFSQNLEPAFSSIKIEDAKGNPIAAADKAVDPSDRTMLRVSVPALAPGSYRVVWRVLSIDSHVTTGDFTFEIAP
jgi:methionine-rich copper-binding protein CopC